MRSLRTKWLAVIFLLALNTSALGAEISQETLDRGLRTEEAVALSYVHEAKAAPRAERLSLLDQAIAYAPNFPPLYIERAWASLPDVFTSLTYFISGLGAYKKNFWWTFSLRGLLIASSVYALYAALFIAAAIRMPIDIPHLAHEINERKSKLGFTLIPLLMAPLGPAPVVAGVLVLLGIYFKKTAKFTVYFALLLMLLSPLTHRITNYYFSGSAPEMRAMVEVAEAKGNAFPIEVLEGRQGFAERFSHATALKRAGRYEEAVREFQALAGEHPNSDLRLYTNLGNAYVGLHEYALAKEAYALAKAGPAPVAALYNLSQIYREELNYTEGDKFYEEAMGLDRARVSDFTFVVGQHPNRLVMDENLTDEDLAAAVRERTRDVVSMTPVNPWVQTVAAAVLLVVFFLIDHMSGNRSFRCSNCGKIICPLCIQDKRPGGTQCNECFTMEQNPDDLSPKVRVARMLTATKEKEKTKQRIRALSFIVPGLAHVYLGKVFAGFVQLWLFVSSVLVIALNPLFETGLAGYGHGWLVLPALITILMLYAISIVSIGRRLEMGWL